MRFPNLCILILLAIGISLHVSPAASGTTDHWAEAALLSQDDTASIGGAATCIDICITTEIRSLCQGTEFFCWQMQTQDGCKDFMTRIFYNVPFCSGLGEGDKWCWSSGPSTCFAEAHCIWKDNSCVLDTARPPWAPKLDYQECVPHYE